MNVVRDLLGSRYGGIWIAPEAGEDRLNVRVVGLDEADERRLRNALPDGLKLSVFDARFSHRELLDLYGEIDDSDIWDRFPMINGLGVSDRLNAVEITLQHESPGGCEGAAVTRPGWCSPSQGRASRHADS